MSEALEPRTRKAAAKKSEAAARPKESVADQLIKYKDLLDKGILTQEEFDEVKRMLLKEI